MLDIEKVTLTTLCENSVATVQFMAEWGLSIHLAIQEGPSILFDAGQRLACAYNAQVAGIRLSEVDLIVLSHGHTDHTGGLGPVLEQMRREAPGKPVLDILCHPAAVEPQFMLRDNGYMPLGCPYPEQDLARMGARIKTASLPTWVADDVVTSGEVPMVTDFEQVTPVGFLKNGDEYVNSPFIDDQAIFLRTNRGLVVVSGCAHRGIINTILHGQKLTGTQEVYLVIGGTHLANTPMFQQEATLKALQDMDVKLVGVSHCTGMKPASFLAHNLGAKKFFFNNAGTRITFKSNGVQVQSFESYAELGL